jgi:flavin reductase (DIM6/NTAB) family NADH-FMN oxidoreductase RutF
MSGGAMHPGANALRSAPERPRTLYAEWQAMKTLRMSPRMAGADTIVRGIGAMMALPQMHKPTSAEFRRAMSRFATGVTVLTVAQADGEPKGMTANAFASVSLEPPLVLVCVDWRARTHDLLRDAEHFGVSVLDENQQAVAEFFAAPDGRPEDLARLGIRFRRAATGTPYLEGCLAHLVCRRVAAHRAGDHTIYIGQAEQLSARDGRPLLFYSGAYRSLAENGT